MVANFPFNFSNVSDTSRCNVFYLGFRLGDMNPTTDHFYVPERAKLQEEIQKRFKYQIKKIMEWLTLESDYKTCPW